MAKYKEGRADIRGHENWIVQFPWVKMAHVQSGAHPANDLKLRRDKVQKARIVVSKIII
jgi:hypothetical protein